MDPLSGLAEDDEGARILLRIHQRLFQFTNGIYRDHICPGGVIREHERCRSYECRYCRGNANQKLFFHLFIPL